MEQNATPTIKSTWKPFKFINGITKCKKVKFDKVHLETIDQYQEIKPYERNKITGEILNNTDKYIYKKIEPRNIYKEIQSQAKEADIMQKVKNMTPKEHDKYDIKKGGIYLDLTAVGNIHTEHEKTTRIEKELAIAEAAYKAKTEELKKQKIIEEYKKEEAKKAAAEKGEK